jgi:hypothetical protein
MLNVQVSALETYKCYVLNVERASICTGNIQVLCVKSVNGYIFDIDYQTLGYICGKICTVYFSNVFFLYPSNSATIDLFSPFPSVIGISCKSFPRILPY